MSQLAAGVEQHAADIGVEHGLAVAAGLNQLVDRLHLFAERVARARAARPQAEEEDAGGRLADA
jgi:hypothetical protein